MRRPHVRPAIPANGFISRPISGRSLRWSHEHMNLFTSFLARFPVGAAILYVGLVALFAIMSWTTVMDILERREAVAATADILNQLEGRRPPTPRNVSNGDVAATAGAPLIEGATVTVGGANLLQ